MKIKNSIRGSAFDNFLFGSDVPSVLSFGADFRFKLLTVQKNIKSHFKQNNYICRRRRSTDTVFWLAKGDYFVVK